MFRKKKEKSEEELRKEKEHQEAMREIRRISGYIKTAVRE